MYITGTNLSLKSPSEYTIQEYIEILAVILWILGTIGLIRKKFFSKGSGAGQSIFSYNSTITNNNNWIFNNPIIISEKQ
jgi:hypothetical protein